ncbi:hypothetical protein [Geobacter sp. AOG1]|uniref:hypothetical protein n=1 Tax=Geobacter sp. AOG1 TaxID=1566346 RepID=UPI001CC674A7|nr:hypothetical protein [Geobacter sp. AOG1]GFE58993.1 hypothetical protein AOG1_28730 [Geobacter sp. AOG1]
MKKNIIIVASAVLLLVYLACSRSLWLSGLERQVAIGRDRLSKPIDIEKTGKIIWRIPQDQWKYTGQVNVALEVDNIQTIPRSAYNKDSMALRVAMDATAIAYTPSNSGMKEVLRADRLIRNGYFTTNKPFAPEARIWVSGGAGTYEFGLCGVNRYPWEDTIVEIDILRADPTLGKANPRLVAYGDYDHAVYEHIGSLRVMRDIVLLSLALCIGLLAYYGMKKESNPRSDHDRA